MAALSACTVLALPAAAAADRRAPPLAARPHLAGKLVRRTRVVRWVERMGMKQGEWPFMHGSRVGACNLLALPSPSCRLCAAGRRPQQEPPPTPGDCHDRELYAVMHAALAAAAAAASTLKGVFCTSQQRALRLCSMPCYTSQRLHTCAPRLLPSPHPPAIARFPFNQTQARSVRVAAADIPGDFSIPAAPILIPAGPWKEIDGCVCAPKGFKAQGACRACRHGGWHAVPCCAAAVRACSSPSVGASRCATPLPPPPPPSHPLPSSLALPPQACTAACAPRAPRQTSR